MLTEILGTAVHLVVLLIVGAPLFALALLLMGHIALGKLLSERRIQQVTASVFGLGLLGTLLLMLSFAFSSERHVIVQIGSLLSLRGYHFDLAIELTPLTLAFLALTFALSALVGAYSARYLHRDSGFFRFYLLLVVFALGMELIVTARSLTLLFAGWELVGMTSALLIAFYYRRLGPTRHGLRAYATYRATDIGLLLAVAILEHAAHSADFDRLDSVALPASVQMLVALLIVFGAMGKGAIVPFTGWLPKAMEGPTPSSAIFYGALSIHASPYLLLRAAPLIERVPIARGAIIVLGALTFLHAMMVGRTRPDIKTALGYASVAQVALIWVEVGLGLYTLAIIHILGHAAVRTWQLLRAPSVLSDHAVRAARRRQAGWALSFGWWLPGRLEAWLYRASLDQWHFDSLARALIVAPVRAVLLWIDAGDRRARSWLGAEDVVDAPRPSQAEPTAQPVPLSRKSKL